MSVTTYTPTSSQVVHETKVDFGKRTVQKTVNIVQYDKSLPIVAVSLYLNGNSYTAPENCTMKIRWGKRDHTFVYKECLGFNAARTIVYFDVDEQMTYFYGPCSPILEMTVDGKIAGSSAILVEIDRNPIQETDIESAVEYVDLTKAVAAAAASEANAKTSETNAAKSATAAAGSASSAANSAQEAAETLESVVVFEGRLAEVEDDNKGQDKRLDNIEYILQGTLVTNETDEGEAYQIDIPTSDKLCPDAMLNILGGKSTKTPTITLANICSLIADGKAKNLFDSGDQLNIPYTYSGTKYDCPNNVVDFTDCTTEDGKTHKCVTLEWEYTTNGITFDPSEAMVTVGANGMPAGTYYFTVANDAWCTSDNGKNIQFTLTEALTEGMQLRPTQSYNATHVGAKMCVYADGKSTTALYSLTMSEGSSGIFLGTMGGTDTSDTAKTYLKSLNDDSTHYINHCHCVIFGNNRWKYSYIRQYLNSSGTGWWVSQHCWDRAPSSVDSIQGFLSGFDSEFIGRLKATKTVTPVNTTFYSETTDTTYDKVFLHSKKNMCWAVDGDESLNTQWEYYREKADSIVGEGKDFQNYQTYAGLIKYALTNKSSAQYVWSRCVYRSYASYVWFCGPSGTLTINGAYDANSALPAYNLIGD